MQVAARGPAALTSGRQRPCRPACAGLWPAPTGLSARCRATAEVEADSAVAGWEEREERGTRFVAGPAFYRPESCAGRDLAVLAAALQRKRTGRLRVLDVMAASGMRGARYLLQADADEVWCNDLAPDAAMHSTMTYNLCTAAAAHAEAANAAPGTDPAAANSHASNASTNGGSSDHSAGSSAAGGGPVAADGPAGAEGAAARRQAAAAWEARARVVRLEGLTRDVCEWDFPPLPPASPDPEAGVKAETIASSGTLGAQPSDEGAGTSQPTSSSPGASAEGRTEERPGPEGSAQAGPGPGSSAGDAAAPVRRVRITHADANRLLTNCFMREDYYDLVDVDSFGSETQFLPAAIDAVRFGGLLYLTSTDGFTSSGKRPERALAAYGCYPRATPWANEQGLRMLIGAAVREAAARGVVLRPVFSLYSYHGPVFRVMLRATSSAEWESRHYGFLGHCFVHGDNYTLGWRSLAGAVCRCDSRGKLRKSEEEPQQAPADASASAVEGSAATEPEPSASPDEVKAPGPSGAPTPTSTPAPTPLVVAGPMWTGPLHDAAELRAMAAEAERRGWTGTGLPKSAEPGGNRAKSSRNSRPLQELLQLLIEEADPRLAPGFISVDDSLSRRLARPPPRDALIEALREEGFAAARCHLESRAIRTNACMEDVLTVAEQRLGIKRRR
ncbi:hypothetical protein HYH03_002711 [Edaphochlamys debaryana]|uniref:Uncharacterized protein n=1 Tax=Edaphochlamys debaryana TaxID=47281 RepID=A0A835YAJ4_9CHLO|nr:hypothetical protein HYH03_002711 [Edaphochlamys debaryana]|eukprot:KAG2499128.1 hypothetical protein HYH03_002711 [Edaphochlamys debaryana]